MVVIKMTLVSKSALCLVYLSSLVVGLPTSASDQDTEGPTKIELLVAGGSQRTDNVEATTVTAADSPGNNALRSQSEPFAALAPTERSSEPVVVDSGDRTRVEYERKTPSLNYFQTLLVGVLEAQPIVDTIREEEKYGNDGERLGQVGRSVVTGVEKLTTFLSSAVNLPYDALKSFTRKATETLNNIGAKIVGI